MMRDSELLRIMRSLKTECLYFKNYILNYILKIIFKKKLLNANEDFDNSMFFFRK